MKCIKCENPHCEITTIPLCKKCNEQKEKEGLTVFADRCRFLRKWLGENDFRYKPYNKKWIKEC